jgi:glycosyltransferase involved in cell wall biosynthesis
MGRRHQLEQVYRRNIERASSYGNVEFVLLDYASKDGLADWVHAELGAWLERGIVRFVRTDQPVAFDMAHAKNVAHLQATGDILVNLDADNWFESGFAEELATLFAGGPAVAGLRAYRQGCMGRIAVRRSDFIALGGYDEDLRGWGYEDVDFLVRAMKFGLKRKRLHHRHAGALQHDDAVRFEFIPIKDKLRLHRMNKARSQVKLAKGQLIANAGRAWGTARMLEPGTRRRA